MDKALDPAEIFDRAADEGRRRLDQTLLELVATGFIAGFTIIFGTIAMAIVESLAKPAFGDFAPVLGALAFGFGIVFLIVGRAELFSENFFDPIAAAFEPEENGLALKLTRLWVLTFILNLIGGGVMILVLSVEGTLPSGAPEVLVASTDEIARRHWSASLMRAIVGGALVALLSYLAIAARETMSRIMLAYAIGVLLALGPFEHIIITLLHIGLGAMFGANITPGEVATTAIVVIAGNLIGGVGLVTLSHAAQARAAQKSSGS